MSKPILSIDTDFNFEWLTLEDDPSRPERNLLAAVLERSLADALFSVGRHTESERYEREAYAWIVHVSFKKRPKIFSFQWVCENLDLDPRKIRKNVIRCKKRGLKFFRTGGRSGQLGIRAA